MALFFLVRTHVPISKAMDILAAKTAVDKEWEFVSPSKTRRNGRTHAKTQRHKHPHGQPLRS